MTENRKSLFRLNEFLLSEFSIRIDSTSIFSFLPCTGVRIKTNVALYRTLSRLFDSTTPFNLLDFQTLIRLVYNTVTGHTVLYPGTTVSRGDLFLITRRKSHYFTPFPCRRVTFLYSKEHIWTYDVKKCTLRQKTPCRVKSIVIN